MKKKYCRASEAARILGIRVDSLARLARTGVLPTKRNGRNERLYDEAMLEKRRARRSKVTDPVE